MAINPIAFARTVNEQFLLSEAHLRHLLTSYLQYYHRWRTPRSLAMDCPDPRPATSLIARAGVGGCGPGSGRITSSLRAGGGMISGAGLSRRIASHRFSGATTCENPSWI